MLNEDEVKDLDLNPPVPEFQETPARKKKAMRSIAILLALCSFVLFWR